MIPDLTSFWWDSVAKPFPILNHDPFSYLCSVQKHLEVLKLPRRWLQEKRPTNTVCWRTIRTDGKWVKWCPMQFSYFYSGTLWDPVQERSQYHGTNGGLGSNGCGNQVHHLKLCEMPCSLNIPIELMPSMCLHLPPFFGGAAESIKVMATQWTILHGLHRQKELANEKLRDRMLNDVETSKKRSQEIGGLAWRFAHLGSDSHRLTNYAFVGELPIESETVVACLSSTAGGKCRYYKRACRVAVDDQRWSQAFGSHFG